MKSFFHSFSKSAKNLKDLRSLTTTAVFIALAIAIKYLDIQLTPDIRISFTFLPICAIGMMYGPTMCGLSYLCCDFLGYITSDKTGQPYDLRLAAIVMLAGIIYGLCLYGADLKEHRKAGCIKLISAKLLTTVICDMTLKTYVLYIMLRNKDFSVFNITKETLRPFLVYCTPRFTKSLILLPIEILLMFLFLPAVKTAYDRVKGQLGKRTSAV